MPKPQSAANAVAAAAPAIFVLFWSTGFVGAKYGLPFAEPFTLLTLRMALTLALLAPFALAAGLLRADRGAILNAAFAGVLLHTIYLGGIFLAIDRGMPAGVSALVIALQPMLTAVAANRMLGERLDRIQIAALLAGIAGVGLVLAPKLGGGVSEGFDPLNLAAITISVIGFSIGAVLQKKHASGIDIRISVFAQYLGALLPLAALSLMLETRRIDWTPQFVLALAWLVLVLSIGANGLLAFLIARNSAARTAALFYLVPAVTAVLAWLLFGETLSPIQFVGMGVTIVAVAVATRPVRAK